MKKSVVIIAILALVAVFCGGLVGCNNTAPGKGTAWSAHEYLTYGVTDEGGTRIGTMSVELEKLDKGTQVTIPEIREGAFTVSENFGNAKITTKVVDAQGDVILESVCLIDGCGSLASYKKVDYQDTHTVFRGYYESKKLYYSESAEGEFKKVKIKSGYMDNQAIYFALRCQELDSGYSASYNMVDGKSGSQETIAVVASGDSSVTLSLEINYTDKTGTQQVTTQNCVAVSISKSAAPKGASILAYYTPYVISSATGFQLYNNHNDIATSFHIPARIMENNLTYSIESVSVNY